jgi:hypothetical protein
VKATSKGAQLRRWFSLLVGHWHASSRVAMVLALLTLVFCNLPGQSVTRMEYEIGHPFYVVSEFKHGWPLTYLIRADEGGEMRFLFYRSPPKKSTARDCFQLWRYCEEFYPWLLATNGCIALATSLALGVAFEAWRRQRSRPWHIHLRDCFAAAFALSLVAAWYAYAQRQQASEAAALNDGSLSVRANQAGGITWLRRCLGDEYFQCFDRPFAVAVHERNGWAHLEKLASVYNVDANVPGTTAELAPLAQLPRLEALSLDVQLFGETTDKIIAELPALPNLRGLYLAQQEHRYRRLDRLTLLESIRITEGCIDEHVLREISGLPNLREVALNGLGASADLSFLPSRPRLVALDLYNGDISADALENIGKCSRLRDLSFYMCRVDCSGVRHLSGLAHLERLNLEYTDVADGHLAALAKLRQLREFELTDTKVGGDMHYMSALENLESLDLYNTDVKGADLEPLVGLAHLRSLDLGYTSVGAKGRDYLRQMKQLRWLRVSNFSKDELRALQEALPECSIIRH